MWQVGFGNGRLDLFCGLDHQLDGPVILTDSKSLYARTKSDKFDRYKLQLLGIMTIQV